MPVLPWSISVQRRIQALTNYGMKWEFTQFAAWRVRYFKSLLQWDHNETESKFNLRMVTATIRCTDNWFILEKKPDTSRALKSSDI